MSTSTSTSFRMMNRLALLLLFSVSSIFCDDSDSCSLLVIRSQTVCSVQSNITMGCCDAWCQMKNCPQTTYYKTCGIQYVQVSKCCEGYGGESCKPVCNETCGNNRYCSSPNTCTCIDGWTGQDCEQVTGLSALNVTTNYITLSWNLPQNTDNINGYFIYAENDDDNVNETIYDVVDQFMIEGLETYSSYKACVVPLVFEGNGTENCITVQTSEAVPTSSPEGITVSGVTPTAIVIQWSPPSQPNGAITSYTIYTNVSSVGTISVDDQMTAYFIDGLVEYQSIAVRVSASTSIGEGPTSLQVVGRAMDTMKTVDGAYSGQDGSLATVDGGVALLSWVPPLNVAEVSFYVLRVSEVSTGKRIYQWTLRNDQSYNRTLQLLDEYVPYKLESFVGTKLGEFGLLASKKFFVKEGIPIAHPSNITAARLTDDSIKITWNPLTLITLGGFLTRYTVWYSMGVDSCVYSYDLRELTTSNTWLVINDTAIDSIYCISVFASTLQGNGPSSPSLLVPRNQHTSFTFELFGVSRDYCESWRSNNSCSNNELVEVRQQLIGILNQNCSCIKSDRYFSEEQLQCDTSASKLTYTANIIGTQSNHSSVLADILNSWSRGSPEIIISGLPLRVVGTNNTIDTDTCSRDDDNIYMKLVIALVVLLGLALMGWILTTVVLCMKHPNKSREDHRATKTTEHS